MQPAVSVLFVCLGNICRSPTAHGVFQNLVNKAGLADAIYIDSCGTGDWHIGHAPDERATQKAAQYGYDLSSLRARQLCANDFSQFNVLLAMDKANLRDMRALSPTSFQGKLELFLSYDRAADKSAAAVDEVPDPYYGGEQGFDEVVQLTERAARGLLEELVREYNLSSSSL